MSSRVDGRREGARLEGDTGRVALTVACGDLGSTFVTRLRRSAGTLLRAVRVLAPVTSPADLASLVTQSGARFAMFPTAWLESDPPALLDQLTSATTAVRPVAVGPPPTSNVLGQALRHGLCGVLELDGSAMLIGRALEVID